jgi:hypothetical protein
MAKPAWPPPLVAGGYASLDSIPADKKGLWFMKPREAGRSGLHPERAYTPVELLAGGLFGLGLGLVALLGLAFFILYPNYWS